MSLKVEILSVLFTAEYPESRPAFPEQDGVSTSICLML